MADEDKPGVGASEVFDGRRKLGKWTLSRLRGQDIGTFSEWVKDQREADARKSVAKARALSSERRERIIADLRAEAVGWSDLYDHMVTPGGFEQVLLLSMQVTHPEATLEDVRALAFERGGTLGLVMWIFGVEGLPESTGSGPRQEDEGGPPAVGAAT